MASNIFKHIWDVCLRINSRSEANKTMACHTSPSCFFPSSFLVAERGGPAWWMIFKSLCGRAQDLKNSLRSTCAKMETDSWKIWLREDKCSHAWDWCREDVHWLLYSYDVNVSSSKTIMFERIQEVSAFKNNCLYIQLCTALTPRSTLKALFLGCQNMQNLPAIINSFISIASRRPNSCLKLEYSCIQSIAILDTLSDKIIQLLDPGWRKLQMSITVPI